MVKWMYDHYIITLIIVVYYMLLFGFGTYQLFSSLEQITGTVVSAYSVLAGMPPAAIALIKWRITKDNE